MVGIPRAAEKFPSEPPAVDVQLMGMSGSAPTISMSRQSFRVSSEGIMGGRVTPPSTLAMTPGTFGFAASSRMTSSTRAASDGALNRRSILADALSATMFGTITT